MAPGNYTTPVATKDHLIVQDDDPAIMYTPPSDWYKFGGDGGNYSVTNSYLAQFAFTFVGSEIWYYSDVNGDHGNFSVAIDGVQQGILTSTAVPWRPQVVLYHTTLEPGQHTLTVMSLNKQGNVLSLDYLGYRPVDRASAAPSNTASSSPSPASDSASPGHATQTPSESRSSGIPPAETTFAPPPSSNSSPPSTETSSVPSASATGPAPSTGLLPVSAPPPAHRLNKLVYVGIALGITFFLLLLCVAALLLERRRRRRYARAVGGAATIDSRASRAVIRPFPLPWRGRSLPNLDPAPGYSKLDMGKVG